MVVKMLDCLANQDRALLPCPLFAEQRDERRLACLRILSKPLAGRLLIPSMVEQVIGDLKRQPNVPRKSPVRRSRVGRPRY